MIIVYLYSLGSNTAQTVTKFFSKDDLFQKITDQELIELSEAFKPKWTDEKSAELLLWIHEQQGLNKEIKIPPLCRWILSHPNEVNSVKDCMSIWSLINSQKNSNDITLSDLAERILSRTLFKQVNCSSEQISDFLIKHGTKKIIECIRPYCNGEAEYYLVSDEKKFKTLQQKDDASYLINSLGEAIPFINHKTLRNFDQEIVEKRLFIIEEAVDEVKKLIINN